MFFRTIALFLAIILFSFPTLGSTILVPMDAAQKDHLKSYGLAYWVLGKDIPVDWLLNYRGGSFAFQHAPLLENELIVRGISYKVISDAQYNSILTEINNPEANMDIMKLEKVPKIAVYSPKSKMPWDDAVTLVLTYAEIPYDVLYDEEILKADLPKYDWLHLHHEDFTGQYGKFYASYRHYPWYQEQQRELEESAARQGYKKVSEMKLAVVQKIKEFCAGGGFVFAMCSATDTYDIALAAEGVDIVEAMFDGDPADPQAQQKLNFDKTFAFKDFRISRNPMEYEYSNIDMQPQERPVTEANDYFQLFTFSAKWDPIPTMLTQNHEKTIKGFMGQTTAFRKSLVKPEVVVMGENKELGEIRYMHGTYARGTWTFYSGHDPEDYQHLVGEDPTDLALHPNSPGYRLILNNILFPAAKKKKQKT
ncbi:asparagine synthetase B [Pontibacter sp. E15-1]|uniref:asparagine synthetase B n=1 Tax=Pontibacter sp. E15-1 TaxID=2919918 RepID=UPI001F4FB814|nr:asparagine synthetase B [Pontibacter sp. E15-1]MCJ8163521.1 asparagine synthetase B [Pontibacter sp. E15-1]